MNFITLFIIIFAITIVWCFLPKFNYKEGIRIILIIMCFVIIGISFMEFVRIVAVNDYGNNLYATKITDIGKWADKAKAKETKPYVDIVLYKDNEVIKKYISIPYDDYREHLLTNGITIRSRGVEIGFTGTYTVSNIYWK